jgi:cyclophilin family peptidyl-prolyl cis-trans isomerase
MQDRVVAVRRVFDEQFEETSMKKPRLTNRVVRGIAAMAAVAESAKCSDFLGTPANDDDYNDEHHLIWCDIQKACEWVRKMQAWEDERTCSECQVRPCVCRRSWMQERKLAGEK